MTWTRRLRTVATAGLVLAASSACGTSEEPTATDPAPTSAVEPAAESTTTEVDDVAPFDELEPGCLEVVDTVEGAPLDPDVDLVERAKDGDVPLPPLVEGGSVQAIDVSEYPDTDAYFDHYTAVIEPEERREAFDRYGFSGATDLDVMADDKIVSMLVLEFASPEDAEAYAQLHLARSCAEATDMAPLGSIPGGVAYTRDSDPPLPKVVVVLGRFEVNLSLCNCAPTDAALRELDAWAARLAAPSTDVA